MDEQSIFLAVVDKTSEERSAWLDEACGGEAKLRGRIETLLRKHDKANSFLEKPPVDYDATMDLAPSDGNGSQPVAVGNHSVLKMLGRTLDSVPRVLLRNSIEEGDGPIARPSSPEVPNRNSDSRYQLLGEIARGGMGAIIRGRDIDLGRDLAIKVLLDEHKDKPEVIQRFIEEAQIAGQLQHPGIAPVYELGQFSDQRPFFSMKLVKGETLAALLADRQNPTDDRAKLLGIFEQICQTMAYAHSRGVIHRDLKPANLMIGAFGEVQVMDWGLAKVMSEGGVADEKRAHDTQQGMSIIQTLRSIGGDTHGKFGSQTQMGSVMGTPAYMPPEQALGEIDRLDERADVFGLGAILCEILTGQPPYVADDGTQVFRMASRGKLDDCFVRLDACDADAELIHLAKHCVEVEPADRPKNAGVLSEKISGYLESVETKLRETEMQRAAQAARMVEERKRRRVTLALAASVMLMVCLGGSGWAYSEQQQADRRAVATKRVDEALGEARLHQLLADAIDAPTEAGLNGQIVELDKAIVNAKQAVELAQQEDDTDDELSLNANEMLDDLQSRAKNVRVQAAQVVADNAFQKKLEMIRLNRRGGAFPSLKNLRRAEWPSINVSFAEMRTRATKIHYSATYLYSEAFRKSGIDLGSTDAAKRIRKSAIRESIIAALDDWSRLAKKETKPEKPRPKSKSGFVHMTRNKLLALADAADSSPWRKKLRAALAEGKIKQLETLAGEDEVSEQSPVLIVWLGVALRDAKRYETAVSVLRPAQQKWPGDFWLNMELGIGLSESGRDHEGLGYIRAALAIRPRSVQAFVALATILRRNNLFEEAEAVSRRAIQLEPRHVFAHHNLSAALKKQGKLDEAIAAYRAAIKINPTYLFVYNDLGLLLHDRGKLDEAIAAHRTAIELDPKYALGHNNLGDALKKQGKLDEAIAAYRKCIDLAPSRDLEQQTYDSIAKLLRRQGKLAEAEELLLSQVIRHPVDNSNGSALVVPHKARWKWLHPTDGKDPAEAQKDFHTSFFKLDFDDASWSEGNDSLLPDGGFAYGKQAFKGTDIGQPTDKEHRHTAYFRHRFRTTKKATGLELHCRHDDGIIVYLDGKEVIRDNVEQGPDAYRLQAAQQVSGKYETRLLRFPIDHTLPAGEHVIAISLHNHSGGSSDLRIGGMTLVEVGPKDEE